jgi:hypothetical protein
VLSVDVAWDTRIFRSFPMSLRWSSSDQYR